MFSLELLHAIRAEELERIVQYLHPGARILELGGGTGYQARLLSERGFEVASVDVAESTYAAQRVFPVQIYDGVHLPFADSSFDVVFSSNVLEHVRKLPELQREIVRVLRRDGHCVHVLPSAVWRFWSNATHAVHHLGESRRSAQRLLSGAPAVITSAGLIKHLIRAAIPARHGETGNAISEVYLFSRRHWLRVFERQGFDVITSEPMGIFYTGYKALGARWPLQSRQRAARVLGSAATIYVVRPSRTSR